jgi:hypothetical protein
MCTVSEKKTSQKKKLITKKAFKRLKFTTGSLDKSFAIEDLSVDYVECPKNSHPDIGPSPKCVCDSGYFRNLLIEEFLCSECPAYCAQCSGSDKNSCTKCNLGYTIDIYSFKCARENSKYKLFLFF